jgi:hypothetical protein
MPNKLTAGPASVLPARVRVEQQSVGTRRKGRHEQYFRQVVDEGVEIELAWTWPTSRKLQILSPVWASTFRY